MNGRTGHDCERRAGRPEMEEASAEMASVVVQVFNESRRARVRSADGSCLELSISGWWDLLAWIEVAQAKQTVDSDGIGHAFGPGSGRVGPGRHGADWSSQELAGLVRSFRAGETVAALALAHQRTTGAIEHKLHQLGLVRAADRQFGGPRSAPAWSPPGGDAS